MSFESLTGIAARAQLRVFGIDVNLSFSDGRELKTKAIIGPHMTHLREHNADFESYALIASIAQKDVLDPQSVSRVFAQEKEYQVIKYKLEADGFCVYFLSE